MKVLSGELKAYWEQGWDGRIDFAFQYKENQKPFILQNGHQLTIYETDEKILWSGKIRFVKRVFFR